jgi:hypothetical protein
MIIVIAHLRAKLFSNRIVLFVLMQQVADSSVKVLYNTKNTFDEFRNYSIVPLRFYDT